MNQASDRDPPRRDSAERLALLSQASIRITETLELDVVLRGVVDGACSLTGARHGGVAVLDGPGQVQAFVTSGLTPQEYRLVMELPGRREIFKHLSRLSEPLRLADFASYARESGLPEIGPPLGPVGAFMSTPIRYLGLQVGYIYLSGAEHDAGFGEQDEALLGLFASQAALAISNAGRYRDEQRARADMETLVNTSPVGVAVFDVATGALSYINREARRIVDGLRDPDQSVEQLLEVLTFRRADGWEVSLAENPLAQVLNSGEMIRAEEIVVAVPDGRQVNMIINATPILVEGGAEGRAQDGDVASLVVTLQDLAPANELARQRAEFLGLVSQELLAPLTSIKGSAAAVLEDLARLDPVRVRQFFGIIKGQADRMRSLIWDLLEVARMEAGTLSLAPEPTDVATLVSQARAAFAQSGSANPVEAELPADLPLVAADRQRVLHVLEHLLSNAAGQCPEGAAIAISARQEDSHVAVCVAGQGQGVLSQPAPLLLRELLRRGAPDHAASAARGVSGDVSLGLAVCRGVVEAHGGRIRVESEGPGLGSRFVFTLPAAEEALTGHDAEAGRSASGSRRAERGRGRVLVVAEDPQALWRIRNTLTEAGYTPVATSDPDDIERLVAIERPHLALLDLSAPGTDGLKLLQRVMKLTDAPVVLLSEPGPDRERDLAAAFEAGADDYINKPFSSTELVARVGAALRRRETALRDAYLEPFQLGGLAIDYAQRRVTHNGQTVALTRTEYRLLCELAVNAGQTLNHEHLMRRVWSEREPTDSAMVRVYIRRLRKKLGDSAEDPVYIFNQPRIGYRLGKPAEPADAASPTAPPK